MKRIYFFAIGIALSVSAIGQTYTFTSAGVTGRLGPNQTQVNAAYTATTLDGDVTVNTQGIQEWTVPATGLYSIQTEGASGGSYATFSGYGAQIYGEVNLTMGTTLYILVGQMGSQYGSGSTTDGGGGGTFVTDGTDLLFASGGGGGAAQVVNPDQDASLTATVASSIPSHFGSTAAGYSADGVNFNYGTYTAVAQSFLNNGEGQAGGQAGGWPGTDYGDGGFGGGGSSCSCGTGGGGGGGGYLGGGGGGDPFAFGPYPSGFGGASYFTSSATNTAAAVLSTYGDGQVVITLLCDPLITSVSSDTVCMGEMVTLHAESQTGGTISWDNGITDNAPFTPGLGTTTYTATSSDPNECSFSADILVNPLPAVDAGMDINLCSAEDTLLYGTGASSYVWNNGITDSVSFLPPTGLTVYTVTGTDTNNCVNTSTVSITVGGPVVTAIITNENVGSDGAIDLNVNGGSGTYTYSWSNGSSTQDLSGLISGTYTVSVNDGLCTTDSTFTITNVAGINTEDQKLFSVYPNPTSSQATILFDGQFDYIIYNTIGAVIMKSSAIDSETIDLSFVEKGIYFVQIVDGNKKQVVKIIKQ